MYLVQRGAACTALLVLGVRITLWSLALPVLPCCTSALAGLLS